MIEEEITSLVITRISENYWVYNANSADKPSAEDAYTGTMYGDLIYIKSLNGTPQLMRVAYSVIDYIDNLDNTNNLTNPSSALEMFGHLLAQGFFVGSAGSGSGGVTTLKQLLDVFISTFAGNEGKYLRIDDDGQFVIASDNPAMNLRIQDLVNWIDVDELHPNFAIVTTNAVDGDGNAIGFTQAPLYNLINRPPNFNELSIDIKGYTIVADTVVPNTQELTLEVGDVVKFWMQEPDNGAVFLYRARYKGGSITNIANFQYVDRYNFKFASEPF